ncbi:MAG: hypothetical protein ACXABY_05895 [Candidatus Thorarchaeota archaeon]
MTAEVKNRKNCIHPKDGLDNSLAAHINMETMLAVQLAQANTALRSARAALLTATKRTLQDRSVQSAIAVIEDVLDECTRFPE